MTPPRHHMLASGLLRAAAAGACLGAAACATAAGPGGGGTAPPPGERSVEASRAEDEGGSYTAADVAFMTGMIHHHAQAVVMARMAPTRGASPAVRRLTSRILNSQKTEIGLMQDWLRDRREPVPEPRALSADPAAGPGEAAPPGGWDAGPQMAGLLADRQMAKLDAARGEEFDRLFLRYMIHHHEGALTMVKELVGSRGAAREQAVFRLATGIRADQAAEIDRMRTMLREMLVGGDTR